MLDLANPASHRNFGYYTHIKIEEIEGVVFKMSKSRVINPNKILVEFWRSADRVGPALLTRFSDVIFRTTKMLEEWGWSTMTSY